MRLGWRYNVPGAAAGRLDPHPGSLLQRGSEVDALLVLGHDHLFKVARGGLWVLRRTSLRC